MAATKGAQKPRNAIGCRSHRNDAALQGIINMSRINIFMHAESDPFHPAKRLSGQSFSTKSPLSWHLKTQSGTVILKETIH